MTVAVIGTGAMGSRIAARLLASGHELVVWNRTTERLSPLLALGAHAAVTPAAAAARATIVMTIVADPASLRAVTEGAHGIAAGAHDDLTAIEMSTVGPNAIARLRAVVPPYVDLLDAPVLGSIGEAEAGKLTIFVGGPEQSLHRARPLLSTLGSVIPVGPLGAGASAKLVANATLFGTLATLGEALALADGLRLSRDATASVLAVTPLAGQAARRLPVIEAGEYPRRFALRLAKKDADLIQAAAHAAGLDIRVLDAVHAWFVDAEQAGLGDRDYTGMVATILTARGAAPATNLAAGTYDGLIVDLDGVIWLGKHPIEGAAEAIERLRASGTKIVFVTNDPQWSRAELAARLNAAGIPAQSEDVLTASAATAAYIASLDHLSGGRALVIGPAALRVEVEQAGFETLPSSKAAAAGVVVVGGHDGFDYVELCAAMTAVAAGAELFATGRDPIVPTHDGARPATGAILAAIETATGTAATVVGKPEPHLFSSARELLACCERVAVVGDNLVSDVAGAKAAGIDAILVLTGATTSRDLERARVQPDVVVSSIAAVCL
jgi:3-hydroxyisobutyrate dehydrogenase